MSGREWQPMPGDVALVRNEWNVWNVAICTLRSDRPGWWWRYGVAESWSPIANPDVRPLVVIDPESAPYGQGGDVSKFLDSLAGNWSKAPDEFRMHGGTGLLRWLSEQFRPPAPSAEPTDPSARVTDRRENVWRLLADGDWVCVDGPDHGEYLVWRKLVDERGPLKIEVDQ